MRQAQLVSAASVLLRPALLTTALESSLERDDKSRATHGTCAIPADNRQATPFALIKRYQSVSFEKQEIILEDNQVAPPTEIVKKPTSVKDFLNISLLD